MAIDKLTQRTPTAAAQIPFSDASSGSDSRCSVAELAAALQILDGGASGPQTQYYAPAATGWSVLVAPIVAGDDVQLLVTPVAGYAAGTITLPPVASCVHGQEVIVSCTQAVTTLTVAGNGATVNGAPTSLAANAFFRLRFDGVFRAWYRVG